MDLRRDHFILQHQNGFDDAGDAGRGFEMTDIGFDRTDKAFSAAVGRQPPGEDGGPRDVAVMAVTTDSPVPQGVLDEIAASEGFLAGRAVTL